MKKEHIEDYFVMLEGIYTSSDYCGVLLDKDFTVLWSSNKAMADISQNNNVNLFFKYPLSPRDNDPNKFKHNH